MRIAIVTGASSGMGKEFVKLILQEAEKKYDEIWLIARREERLRRWSELYPQYKFRQFPLDLQKKESFRCIQDALAETEAEVACLVHAAGFGIMGKIGEISQEEQIEMVDVNCSSTVALTKLLLPFMIAGGRMIYLASSAAFLPQPGFAVYAASKSFVLSFVRSLRRECGEGHYRITAVCPGAVKTEFFDRAAKDKELPAYKKMVMADQKKVVKKAWKDNEKNREISVYGKMMQGFALLAKLLPHSFILHFVKS